MQNAASSRNRTSQQFGFQPITHHSQIQQSTRTDPSTLHLGGHMGSATTPTNGAQHGEGAPVLSNHDDMGPNVSKKSLPANGKKTKGRVKIKMEFIDNKLRRYTTFSKRKTGIMKKAYELSTLTGTQVMLLVASETGHVYTFATRKLQPMITSEAGKALIQTCLNSPDPPPGPGGSSGLDQRMSATGFEETDLTYSVGDDCEKKPYHPGTQGNASSAVENHNDHHHHHHEYADFSIKEEKLPPFYMI